MSLNFLLWKEQRFEIRKHLLQNVAFSSGSRVVELFPRSWNDSASQVLQLNLYQYGATPFMSPLPTGPVITATYFAPSGSGAHAETAAAVLLLLPLLVVVGTIVIWDKIKRHQGKET
ncbi:hypothetical protein F5887DRAFT_924580 [Amanita rubescens]|nr:hypothetical protein F5887DRAFT_924580 [Amanita rubescens]